MAGIHLTIDTRGLDQLQARIQGLAGMDTTTLMPRLGEYLQASTQDRFKTQTAPDGSPWDALAPRTLERKKHNRDKVLTARGFLRRGIRYQVLDKSTVQVGTDSVYAATHQYGRDEANIPARPFLGLSSTDRREITAIIRDWAAELGFK
ncbi:MAG TPA: phage virion morphogenesis protein [Arenimonas sp.]|nr:phage virion morphogenesis protein [Arenimonas sp.]